MAYQDLIVYRLATTIYDGTVVFCDKFVDKRSRTTDQMIQAARSGKQNIVEGNISTSTESNLKLTNVARASLGELVEDFMDYLRQHQLPVWEKTDQRISKIRAFREDIQNPTNLSNLADSANLSLDNPEHFANIMICLIHKENYLLDQYSKTTEAKFVKEGGFREKLFNKRIEYRKTNWTNSSNSSN